MGLDIGNNSNRRLKAVLDIMAAGVWRGEKPGAGTVLTEAVERVPLDAEESQLLSGGVPRGHKALTTATAKLVKAGWLLKGRSGWSLTDDGLRATVAFPDADSLAAALAAGTPVPADMPVPTAAPEQPKETVARAAKASAKTPAARAKATTAVDQPGTGAAEAAATGTRKSRPRKAAAAPDAPASVEALAPDAQTPEAQTPIAQAPEPAQGGPSAVELGPQPDSVAIVGDFGILLGAPENWEPDFAEVQMSFDDSDRLWKLSAELPEGFYSYKAVVNRSWDENYGAFGVRSGSNHELHHAGGTITFRYDHGTKDVLTD
ncbi:glycosidase [Paenarthrobacter sp. PH39-S1]|uniref:pullulanase X25 domain-containing protein n=1 Tax=Paenarthrobacter sp. PH39-S1 TaxID=3046204 RepID=UPI0032D94400